MAEAALSTMWGIGQFPRLGDFFQAGRALGFTHFELNHGVDSRMLGDSNLNGHRIPSIHEPCPADISMGTLKARNWLISATDEDERRAGVHAVERSIDLAQELGAQIVVVHPGRVDLDAAIESRCYAMYGDGKSQTPEYAELRQELMQARAARADVNMRSVRKSLVELAEYAHKRQIRLGLENRFHYHEIPLPDELDMLLGLGYDDIIGYWHDVGHAQVLENLGFNKHAEWLQRFGPRIVGTHLHDVVGIQDHQAAGLGMIDWDLVARSLPAAALRTCEFQNTHSPEQVKAGVRWLVKNGIVRESSA